MVFVQHVAVQKLYFFQKSVEKIWLDSNYEIFQMMKLHATLDQNFIWYCKNASYKIFTILS